MNRKFLIAITVVFSAITGLWIWTLALPKNVINIGGSASVDPIMQRATNKYQSKTKQSFIYSSTGSTSGINNLKSQVYQIGFISKEVPAEEFEEGITALELADFQNKTSEEFVNSFSNEKEEGYYSVNFANDAIVFLYNIKGTGFEPFADYLSFDVEKEGTIQDNRLLKLIYQVDKQSEIIKWPDLAKEIMDMNDLVGPDWDENLKKVKNIDVTPYASTPGSGTLTSFETITKGVIPGQAVNRYGNNGSIFAQISASSGAFGFVNLAFAREATKSKFQHLKTAIIYDSDGNKWNIGEDLYPGGPGQRPTYPLSRPFIAIFSNDRNNQKMKEVLSFIFWFATDRDLAKDYSEEGLKQLLITDQFLIENFWIKRKELRVWLKEN